MIISLILEITDSSIVIAMIINWHFCANVANYANAGAEGTQSALTISSDELRPLNRIATHCSS